MEKKIEWSKLLQEAITLEGSLGNTFNRFYSYSYANQLFLMIQGVKEPVNTFQRWNKMGRKVKKGSKAKSIICPIVRKNKETDEIDGVFFKIVKCLFTVSETDGEDIPEPTPANFNIDQALEILKIERKDFEHPNGNIQGYAKGNSISINPLCDSKLETIIHEIAHIVLGHTKDTSSDKLDRDIKEFQAETTAYIVMNELNEATDKSRSAARAYIQGWLKDNKPNEKEIRSVFSTVDKILKAGVVA